jgi:hypothetical protein
MFPAAVMTLPRVVLMIPAALGASKVMTVENPSGIPGSGAPGTLLTTVTTAEAGAANRPATTPTIVRPKRTTTSS